MENNYNEIKTSTKDIFNKRFILNFSPLNNHNSLPFLIITNLHIMNNDRKNFKLKENEFLDLVPQMGGCFATDKITVDGMKVGYMYREESDEKTDSGWRFFSGTEDQEYVDNPDNTMIYNVNTIANYDRAIIPYLDFSFGTELERIENTDTFQIITE